MSAFVVVILVVVGVLVGLALGYLLGKGSNASALSQAQSDAATAKATLDAERNLAAQRATDEQQNLERLKTQFEALAADALKANTESFLTVAEERLKRTEPEIVFTDWRNAFVGAGARSIAISPDGQYLFAAVNNLSQVSIVRTANMKMLGSVRADSFPVGMAISPAGDQLIVTAQGVSNTGGNSVMIFSVQFAPL
jgi:glucose/arabinose dehydrogenase